MVAYWMVRQIRIDNYSILKMLESSVNYVAIV